MPPLSSFFATLRQLIAQGQLDTALAQLRAFLENSPLLDEAIHQAGRWSHIQRQIRLGTVSHAEATLTQNQVQHGVLELITDIEREMAETPADGSGSLLTPAIRAEMQQSISVLNSKNVIAGGANLSAGGNIHIGDIVYAAAPPPTAAVAPKPVYNKELTRLLVEALRTHQPEAERLCQNFGWLEQPANLKKVQNFLCRNYVGEIGKQMRKLVNIGDDQSMDEATKRSHFVEKCLDIARTSLDLINCTLVSVWWDTVKTTPYPLDPAQHTALSAFFEKNFEPSLSDQVALLRTLSDLFAQHHIEPPFLELPTLRPHLDAGGDLERTAQALEASALSREAEKAEAALAALMGRLTFLSHYRMASIKKIAYRQIRDDAPRFLHRYVSLGIDVKYSEDAEKGNYTDLGEQTPAILLYRGDRYQNGVSLFPFIIDYNALTFEQGAKVCFFTAKDLSSEALEYRFLGDNSLIRIEKEGIRRPDTDLNELMLSPEKLRTLNLDCVVEAFYAAQGAILGIDII